MSDGRSLAERSRAALSAAERDVAIAYLDDRSYGPGEPLLVDRRAVEVAAPSRVVFVDLEPAANWAHRACFVILPEDGRGEVVVPAQMPPYRGSATEHFTLLWRGVSSPDWAVAVSRTADPDV